jgi:hypothetical protein
VSNLGQETKKETFAFRTRYRVPCLCDAHSKVAMRQSNDSYILRRVASRKQSQVTRDYGPCGAAELVRTVLPTGLYQKRTKGCIFLRGHIGRVGLIHNVHLRFS